MIDYLFRAVEVFKKTATYGLKLAVAELPPEIRFEVERYYPVNIRVTPSYHYNTPHRYRWSCPNPNYDWHYGVDDQGFADLPDQAIEAGEAHWREYHQGRWPGA